MPKPGYTIIVVRESVRNTLEELVVLKVVEASKSSL